MLQGPLLSLLLIQTQYMKREMLRQMNALDTLLRENLFTASMSALLPGVLAVGAATTVIRRFIRVIRSRRRSRKKTTQWDQNLGAARASLVCSLRSLLPALAAPCSLRPPLPALAAPCARRSDASTVRPTPRCG